MNDIIKHLNPDYELLHYKATKSQFIFMIAPKKDSSFCPYCGTLSTKVHSCYQREIQDLPLQGKQSILLVDTRKFFCTNPECKHTTFSERHPFTAKNGKKTERLVENIIQTSLKMSSINASKLLKNSAVKSCKSSICELLKKMPNIVDESLIEKICVDDFAFRKRFSYGTVMVNLETHKIIDILPSREMVDVKAWLDTFPNIKVVSRDGSASYASAIRLSHPEAIQISDRFHLLKGLSEAVNKFIIREFHSRVEIPAISPVSPEMLALYETSNRAQRIRFAHKKRKAGLTVAEIALLLHSCPTTIRKYLSIPENKIPEDVKISRERQHKLAIKQKQKEIEEAKNLFSQGYSIEKIGIMMNHITPTIKNYLNPSYSAINGHYDNRIPGKLAPYEQQVIELRSKGITY